MELLKPQRNKDIGVLETQLVLVVEQDHGEGGMLGVHPDVLKHQDRQQLVVLEQGHGVGEAVFVEAMLGAPRVLGHLPQSQVKAHPPQRLALI